MVVHINHQTPHYNTSPSKALDKIKKTSPRCTDPQKLDLKNLIFGGRFSFGKI